LARTRLERIPVYLFATGLVTAAARLLLKQSRCDLAGPDQLPQS